MYTPSCSNGARSSSGVPPQPTQAPPELRAIGSSALTSPPGPASTGSRLATTTKRFTTLAVPLRATLKHAGNGNPRGRPERAEGPR